MSRFNRVAVAFNEAVRLCESSGSEHSPNDSIDLSDLVSSFLEVETDEATTFHREQDDHDDDDGYWSESETKQTLLGLLNDDAHGGDDRDREDNIVKQRVRQETEYACEMFVELGLSEHFKRQLMSHLRNKGFDAGLCKSRLENLGQKLHSGNYEYVDVTTNTSRYIVEVNLAAQFEIARPTTNYALLLEIMPPIFIGTPRELNKIVKLMCKAMRASMKTRDMHLPPWRRSGYMQSKWFGRYKRTVKEIPIRSTKILSFHCRDNFGSKGGLKVGYLAAALDGFS